MRRECMGLSCSEGFPEQEAGTEATLVTAMDFSAECIVASLDLLALIQNNQVPGALIG